MSEVSAIIAEKLSVRFRCANHAISCTGYPSMPFSPTLENEIMMNPEKIQDKMRELATILRRVSIGYKNA